MAGMLTARRWISTCLKRRSSTSRRRTSSTSAATTSWRCCCRCAAHRRAHDASPECGKHYQKKNTAQSHVPVSCMSPAIARCNMHGTLRAAASMCNGGITCICMGCYVASAVRQVVIEGCPRPLSRPLLSLARSSTAPPPSTMCPRSRGTSRWCDPRTRRCQHAAPVHNGTSKIAGPAHRRLAVLCVLC